MEMPKSSKTAKGQSKKSDQDNHAHAAHEEVNDSNTQQTQSHTEDVNQPDLLKTNAEEVPSAGSGQSKSA